MLHSTRPTVLNGFRAAYTCHACYLDELRVSGKVIPIFSRAVND
ncbi:MAG: hypothetical protein OXC42_00625 [Gammaproteobacteria bacterium]|nr:hypothetical protein [Gammaproteobacteria bacterium]